MKKTLYSIFAVLSLCLAFVSCDDDDFDVNRGTHSQLPETVVAGTYNGQYVVYKADGVTEVGTYPATVTMTAGESKYTVRLESVCDQADINGAEEMPLNISWANEDIKFWGLTTPGTTAGFLNSAGMVLTAAKPFRSSFPRPYVRVVARLPNFTYLTEQIKHYQVWVV